MLISRRAIGLLGGLLLFSLPNAAMAEWPDRPITLVVPYTPGGSPDVLSRFLARDLGDRLGQKFVVENRTGASGNIGAGVVAKSEPDGYTFLVATPNPIVINKLIEGAKQSFDPDKDLTPVVILGKAASIFVTSPKSSIRTLQDLVSAAKTNPGKLNIGVPGLGTSSHIAVELLSQLTKTKVSIVPYRGPPPLTDIVNAQLDVAVNSTAGYASRGTEGLLRPLAVTSMGRSAMVPDIPTIAELGFKDIEATTWWVIMAPAGTPKPIVDRLNAAINEFIKSPAGQKMFAQFDVQPGGGSPQVAKDYIVSETIKWRPVVKAANFKM
jgi:tripartite-type tricarboxylate transporter receptor subunit TctC